MTHEGPIAGRVMTNKEWKRRTETLRAWCKGQQVNPFHLEAELLWWAEYKGLINGVASVPESLPEGVTPNPQTYTLAAGVALNEDGWEWDDRGVWAGCGSDDARPYDRTICRIQAPPQPATEEVPLAELGGRTAEGHACPVSFLHWGGSGWIAHDLDGRIWPVSPSGMVTVLRSDGTEGGAS